MEVSIHNPNMETFVHKKRGEKEPFVPSRFGYLNIKPDDDSTEEERRAWHGKAPSKLKKKIWRPTVEPF